MTSFLNPFSFLLTVLAFFIAGDLAKPPAAADGQSLIIFLTPLLAASRAK